MIAMKTADGRKTIDGNVFKVFSGDELVFSEDAANGKRLLQIMKQEFGLNWESRNND